MILEFSKVFDPVVYQCLKKLRHYGVGGWGQVQEWISAVHFWQTGLGVLQLKGCTEQPVPSGQFLSETKVAA